MAFSIRPAAAGDAPFLVDMLVEAVNWRPGRAFSWRRVMSDPASAHYVTGWPRDGDHGVIAEAGGTPIGAAWLRLLPADDPGYGFVAADVPELSIAVVAGWRGRGVGRTLLRAAIARTCALGTARISLSVERDNPARALYHTEGFRTVRADQNSETMVLSLADVAAE